MPTDIYRSIGSSGDKNTSNRDVTIVASTATFSGAMPGNVGVGDAIEYTVGSVKLAFIHGRTSSTVFTVKNKTGGVPTATGGEIACDVFRAYRSQFDAESQNENADIAAAVRNFDVSTNLTANDRRYFFACYADAVDTTTVDWNGWTVDATRYYMVYAPKDISEVGASQRHTGIADTGYRIEGTGAGVMQFSDDYAQALGVVIKQTGNAVSDEGLRVDGDNCLVDSCVVWTDQDADQQDGIYVDGNNTENTIQNCIVYGFRRAGILLQVGANLILNAYENSIWDCGREWNNGGGGIATNKGDSTINAIGNWCLDCNSGANSADFGSFGVAPTWNGNNNISSDTSVVDEGIGTLDQRTLTDSGAPGVGDWVIVNDITNPPYDLLLQNNAENDAQSNGTDVGVPGYDIVGTTRPVGDFDVGAHQVTSNGLIPCCSHVIGRGIRVGIANGVG